MLSPDPNVFGHTNALAGLKDGGVFILQSERTSPEQVWQIVRDFQKDLKAFNPNISPTFGSLEGYIAVRIFAEALKKWQGPLSRETVVDALEGLGSFDLGLNVPLHLGPLDHQASHRVWPTILRNGHIQIFNWDDIPGILHNARR